MNFYRVPGNGWTIELLLEEGESPENVENTDGWVTVHGEGQWAFTLLTVAELNRLMARWQQTGEYHGGAYFTCPDLVLLRRPGVESLTLAIQDLVSSGGHHGVLMRTSDERSNTGELPAIRELPDRWILGLRDLRVVEASSSVDPPEVYLVLADGTTLIIEGAVEQRDGPLGPTLNQVEDLINTTVRSAVAFKSGATRLVFSNGHHLNTRQTPAPPLRVDGLAGANHLFDNGIHTTTPMGPVPEG